MRRWALLIAALCALAFPATAGAHASFVRSEPRDGAVLAKSPPSVRLVFDDEVRVISGIRAIRNGGGSILGGEPKVSGGRVLVVPLRRDLPAGDYTVLWRVLADDGHRLAGVMSFGIGAGRPPPTPALSVNNRPSVSDVISRWLFFAGLLTAAGAALFRLAVAPVPPRLLLGAFLLVFVGVSGAIHDVSVSTRFGAVMAAAAVVAGIGALFAAVAPLYPRFERLPSLAGLLLLPVPSLAGHALDSGRHWIQVVVDALHVGAASLWLGGLVALALALRRAEARTDILRRFSRLALASVLVIAATGVIRAFSELDAINQIWSIGYGRVLIVKTALLGLLVTLGWVNRYRLLPRGSLTSLRRSVSGELAVFVVLVGAVALLTDLRPGRDRVAAAAPVRSQAQGPPPLPPRRAIVLAQQDGELAVGLAYRPSRAQVTVVGPDRRGIDGLAVEVAGVKARSCGSGCYAAGAAPAKMVTVVVDGRRHVFRLPSALRVANGLVTRATRVFRGLRSVGYVERLASSPRDRVVADFTLEAPNRLEYRIRAGASGIIIGSRRWDRARAGRWIASPQQPTSQPEPTWAGGVTNVYFLGSTSSTVRVAFLKPLGPAWFTLTLDRRTFLPRRLTMVAPAHFMTHRYVRFNGPRTIRPPKS